MNALRFLISASIFVAAPTLVFGHSGGLNANGCHAGSQPYHCHRAQAPVRRTTGSGCNSNYSGCVPNASDVDCAGGSQPSLVCGREPGAEKTSTLKQQRFSKAVSNPASGISVADELGVPPMGWMPRKRVMALVQQIDAALKQAPKT